MSTANRLLVAMAGTFGVVGVIEPHVPHVGTPLSPLDTAHGLVMAVLLFSWCRADAAARGLRPPAAAPILVALIAIVGVPYYFIRVLPFPRALAAIGKSLLFFLMLLVVYFVCYFLSVKVS